MQLAKSTVQDEHDHLATLLFGTELPVGILNIHVGHIRKLKKENAALPHCQVRWVIISLWCGPSYNGMRDDAAAH